MKSKSGKIRPVLSIIIVNYNTKELLRQCLESIFKNDKRLDFSGQWIDPTEEERIPAEIIIVDNNSTDGSVEFIKSLTSLRVNELRKKKKKKKKNSLINNRKISIKLIENKKNLGFAKANNQGIKIARGEYILLLNSDTIIPEGAISQTIYWLSAHPKVGVVSCKLLNRDRTIQPTGGFFPNLANIFTWVFFLDDLPLVNRLIKPFHPHPPQFWTKEGWYLKTRELDWVTGAFFLIRKAVIREVGLLRKNFFMYVEEVEWCYRIKKAGWRVFFYDGAKIIHLGGASGKSITSIVGEDQGLVKFFSLHKPKWQLPILKAMLKIKNLLRFILFIILGKRERAQAYLKALVI